MRVSVQAYICATGHTHVFVRFSRESYSLASPLPILELKKGRAAACAVGLRALKLTVLALLRFRCGNEELEAVERRDE